MLEWIIKSGVIYSLWFVGVFNNNNNYNIDNDNNYDNNYYDNNNNYNNNDNKKYLFWYNYFKNEIYIFF